MPILLPIHIVAAGLGIVAGAIALSVAKGAWLHRRSGLLFVWAIVAMCASAVVMALWRGQTGNVIAGLLTAYLAVTALLTVRPRSAGSRPVDIGLMLLALALGVTTMTLGFQAIASADGKKFGLPAFPFFMFSAFGLLAGLGDARILRSGYLRGAPRIARHLWRMCIALFIAAASFFSIRSRVASVLPEVFTTPVMRALPVLLVILAMFYWLWRVRFRPAYRGLRFDGPAKSFAGLTKDPA